MKKERMKLLTVSAMVIVLSAAGLSAAMTNAQGKTVETVIEAETADAETGLAKETGGYLFQRGTEFGDTRHITSTGFTLVYDSENMETTKTEADMEMEEALAVGLQKLEEIYEVYFEGNIVLMDLNSTEDESLLSRQLKRYYTAQILCGDETYAFEVNSVTGEIWRLAKYYDDGICWEDEAEFQRQKEAYHLIWDLYTDEELDEVSEEYYEIAETFLSEYFPEINIKGMKGICPGEIGTDKEFLEHDMLTMQVTCELENGVVLMLDVDQMTKEVVLFNGFDF